METEKLVSISISIPRNYRDQLRKMAAKASLKNPSEFMSVSELGRKILCEHLSNLVGREGMKINENPN
jgi:hypothetical protein